MIDADREEIKISFKEIKENKEKIVRNINLLRNAKKTVKKIKQVMETVKDLKMK